MREGKGFPLRTKVVSVLIAAGVIGAFAIFGTESRAVRAILATVLTAKIVVMAFLPTYRPEPENGYRYGQHQRHR